MKILVAGVTGVIGRVMLPMLLQEGHRVVGLSRQPVNIRDGAFTSRVANVFDSEALMQVFAEEQPDAVIHQLTDLKERSTAANARLRIEGTRNLVEGARSVAVQRIVAQSIAWAFAPGDSLATEETPLDVTAMPPRKTTIDGIIALETAVAELPHSVVLRYGTLYGPGTWYDRDGVIARQMMAGELTANGAITNFVHVVDAARAAVQALAWPNGPINIVDDEPASALEWMPQFAQELGAPAPKESEETSPVARPVTNKRAKDLRWNPEHTSWRHGFFK